MNRELALFALTDRAPTRERFTKKRVRAAGDDDALWDLITVLADFNPFRRRAVYPKRTPRSAVHPVGGAQRIVEAESRDELRGDPVRKRGVKAERFPATRRRRRWR